MVVGALVTSLAVSSGSASAGTVVGDLELTYEQTGTSWSQTPGRASQGAYDPCFGAQRLVGVGAWVGESTLMSPWESAFELGKAWNASIGVIDEATEPPKPDSARQVADTLFETPDVTLRENTTCAESVSQPSYPRAKKASPGGERTTVKAACTGGTHVLSGGGAAPGPFKSQRLVESAPFDSNDAGTKPDDGWRVAVDNMKNKRRSAKAFAICADISGLSYESTEFMDQDFFRVHRQVNCPSSEFVLGGGLRQQVPYGKAKLVASRYLPATFDAWIIELDNTSSTAPSVGRAFAICHS